MSLGDLNDVLNSRIGPMRATYGSDVLGFFDPDGLTVSTDGHKFVPLKVDKYGAYTLDQFDVGIEDVVIKGNLLEVNHDMRKLLYQLGNIVTGGDTDRRIQEGGVPIGSTASLHKTLTLHPYGLDDADKSLDFKFHKVLLQAVGDENFGAENVQAIPVEGKCIIDGALSDKNQLYEIGGVSEE